jgi:ATP phosphoribosyltransferase regulatory subunit
MEDQFAVLQPEEKVALQLRGVYDQHGYQLFRLSSFEEYDLYSQNKAFLNDADIISFTGSDGRLMALKPDVTLAIVNNTPDGETRKVYYNEDVYRHNHKSSEYKRINQIGLEWLGNIDRTAEVEVIALAAESLSKAGQSSLDLSHMGLLQAITDLFSNEENKKKALKALQDKSPHSMQEVAQAANLTDAKIESLVQLTILSGEFSETLPQVRQLLQSIPGALAPLADLATIVEELNKKGLPENVRLRLDFSIVNDTDYYSGVIFQGFLAGLPNALLFGGRYDYLLQKQGKEQGAIGFGMYLNNLEAAEIKNSSEFDDYIDVALPKGRMGDKVYQLFVDAGLATPAIFDDSRKLIFQDDEKKLRFFLVKPSDVDQYVERGAADIGVVGKDVLLESEPDVIELMDLGMGKCKMAVAGRANFKTSSTRPLRVATKYPNITRSYYNKRSQAVELISLHGSIELAPLLNLSDVIVDIVETGTTLKENGLVVLHDVAQSSARLVVNPASWRFKEDTIRKIVEKVSETL